MHLIIILLFKKNKNWKLIRLRAYELNLEIIRDDTQSYVSVKVIVILK